MVDKLRRCAENDHRKETEVREMDNAAKLAAGRTDTEDRCFVFRRYYKLEYKAKLWKHEQ